MQHQEMKAASANIVAIAKGLENFIDRPENYNSFASSLIEETIRELKKQASYIDDLDYMFRCY
jgi:hypothetical protein